MRKDSSKLTGGKITLVLLIILSSVQGAIQKKLVFYINLHLIYFHTFSIRSGIYIVTF